MKNSFLISYKLKITYRVNTVIYSIKQIPLIKRIIPDGIYGAEGLKVLAIIISIIYETFSTFLGKAIYMFLMIFTYILILNQSGNNIYCHLLFFLTIIGSLLNSYMFDASNDKYYAMMLLKMDPRFYSVSNYLFSMIKMIIGFLPFTIILGFLLNSDLYLCFIIPIFIVSMKTNINAYLLRKYKNNKKINETIKWIIIIICILLAYGLPLLKIIIPYYITLIIFILSIILSFINLKYIYNYDTYYKVYKDILSETNMEKIRVNQHETEIDSISNLIENKTKYKSNKEGYAYFNDLFIKRHNKVLYKFAKIITLMIIGISVFVILLIINDNDIKGEINKSLLNILPMLLFFMYYINTGQRVAKILFMNCDNAMLTYNFYRKQNVILSLFKERLKSIVKMNLLPSSVLSICLIIMLFISGGTSNNGDYLLIFVSVNSMSIFFSVHNLIIYYLLQPYNSESDIKGGAFQIINMFTYLVCYSILELKIPVEIFGSVLIVFTFIYVILSLISVYQLAYKTFKIRN